MSTAFSAFILAGGKSRRMGEDKGLIDLADQPVISYVIAEIRKLTEDITIITSNKNYGKFNCKLLEDVFMQKGPAAGIDVALRNAIQEKVFITSCDMPFIKVTSICSLLQVSEGAEISLFQNENFIEPMFTFYKKSCGPKWNVLLLEGTLKLIDFFKHFDTNFVDAHEILLTNPQLFMNINTAQDLQNAARWMKK